MKKIMTLLMIPFLLINFVDAGKKNKKIEEKTTAYELKSGKPAPVEEMRKKLMMVHITDVLPEEGIMVPGKLKYLGEPDSSKIQETVELSKQFPRVSFTLHWSGGAAVKDHEKNNLGQYNTWSTRKYAIIEPYKNVEEELLDGYMEDFFTGGPHKLSDEAIILVPQSESKEILKQYPKLKKHFITYSPEKTNVAQAANFYIKKNGFWFIDVPQQQIIIKKVISKNSDDLQPYAHTMTEESINNALEAFDKGLSYSSFVKIYKDSVDLKITVDGNKFIAGDFFKNLIDSKKLKFCLFSEHPIGKMKEALKEILFPLNTKLATNQIHYGILVNPNGENYMELGVLGVESYKHYVDLEEEFLKLNFPKKVESYIHNFFKEAEVWVEKIILKEWELLQNKKSLFNLVEKNEFSKEIFEKYGSPLDFKKLSSEELDKLIIKGDEETLNELIKDCHKQIEEQGLRKVTFEEEKKEEEKIFN
jgi:hypothetical protein